MLIYKIYKDKDVYYADIAEANKKGGKVNILNKDTTCLENTVNDHGVVDIDYLCSFLRSVTARWNEKQDAVIIIARPMIDEKKNAAFNMVIRMTSGKDALAIINASEKNGPLTEEEIRIYTMQYTKKPLLQRLFDK